MSILNKVLGRDEPKMEDDIPEFKQNKKYRICVEDNPDQKKYRCSKKDIISPDCKLSLYLEELTHEEVMELDLEIRNMLDRHNFGLR